MLLQTLPHKRMIVMLLFFTNLVACLPPLSTLPPVIRLWLKHYREDFHEPPQYQALRLMCAHLRHRLCFRRLAQTAENLLKQLQEQGTGEQEVQLHAVCLFVCVISCHQLVVMVVRASVCYIHPFLGGVNDPFTHSRSSPPDLTRLWQ